MPARVTLRVAVPADVPILSAHQRDADAAYVAGVPSRDEAAYAAHWAKISVDPSVKVRVIEWDGQVVGNVVSFEQHGKRDVGYWIGREHWGQGIATAALALFLDIETARPLHAVVTKRNPASVRVLEKCGFVVSGSACEYDERLGEEIEVIFLTLE